MSVPEGASVSKEGTLGGLAAGTAEHASGPCVRPCTQEKSLALNTTSSESPLVPVVHEGVVDVDSVLKLTDPDDAEGTRKDMDIIYTTSLI